MSRRRLGLVALMAVLSAAALAGLFLVYLRLSQTVVISSDGGTISLQAWYMLHGNVALRGWTVADVSFYTTELPEYALVERLNGLSPEVIHIAGALTYTILLLLTAIVAKGRAVGREALVRMIIAAGILLAPAAGLAINLLMTEPDHYGSAVPVLLAWLIVDQCPPRWYVPAATTVILAWSLVADPLIEVTGVTPMVVVCGVRAVQHARRREPWWLEGWLALGAATAVGLAAAASALLRAVGGFTISPVQTGFGGVGALGQHALLAGRGLLLLFGASFYPGQPVNILLSGLHLVSVVMVAVALGIAVWRFFRRDDLLVPALALAIVLNVGLFIAGTYAVDGNSTREMGAVLPFGAVLAGQVLAAPLRRLRLLPVLAAVLAGYAVTLGLYASQPRVPAAHQDLADWLVANHLSSGLATNYWLANITTVDSAGQVRVVRVSVTGPKVTRPPSWETKREWYQADRNNADFLVTEAVPGSAGWRSVISEARATFGPPVSIRRYGPYTVITWHHNVLEFLH